MEKMIELKVPAWLLPWLINDDASGLSDEEEAEAKAYSQWLEEQAILLAGKEGLDHWHLSPEYGEHEFSHEPDGPYGTLAGDVETCQLVVYTKAPPAA